MSERSERATVAASDRVVRRISAEELWELSSDRRPSTPDDVSIGLDGRPIDSLERLKEEVALFEHLQEHPDEWDALEQRRERERAEAAAERLREALPELEELARRVRGDRAG